MAENIALYMILTDHEEYNKECKKDIFPSLVQAFEKIYTSEVVRLKADKMKKSKIISVLSSAKTYALEAAEQAIHELGDLYEDEDGPEIMSISGGMANEDDKKNRWKWTIEIRLGNSLEDSDNVSIRELDKVPEDIAIQ